MPCGFCAPFWAFPAASIIAGGIAAPAEQPKIKTSRTLGERSGPFSMGIVVATARHAFTPNLSDEVGKSHDVKWPR